jgi:glycosyltransferase involved in cell wall biosynthesis
MYKDPFADVLVDVIPAKRRSMRVAVVSETYPPEVNGVARTVARMVEGLHAREHDLQLVRPRQAAQSATPRQRLEEILVRGMPIPRYPELRMGLPSKRALVRLWSARRPDIVHIATEGPLGWSALSAASYLRLPISSDFRTNFHAYTRHYGLGWLQRPMATYLRKFHNRAHCTMVPTEGLRRELMAAGFERLQVVARGVDTDLFNPVRRSPALRQAWGAQADDLVVACVGRLAIEKNLPLLIDSFRAIEKIRPDARLLLVGDGPMRGELQHACPQATFAGQRGGENLAEHYASADLFLFPSLTETFGNVTTEALASGLPVVAFDYAAAGQLIRHGSNGLLAPVGDAQAFVSAALQAARDDADRRRMGLQARQTALSLGWEPVVDRFETVLSQLVTRG